MRSRVRAAVALASAFAAIVAFSSQASGAGAAGHAPDARGGLDAGELVTFRQQVPVNVVLVGYDRREVAGGLSSVLPPSSTPLVRFPQFYGLPGRDVGLQFDYSYRIVDAPKDFEDGLFRHLARTGTERPITSFQQDYNDQETNILDVEGPVLAVDAPSTELYLEQAARRQLDIDSSGYTVFLVNWFGRSDFRFHVYTKTDEPDPDTHFNFGESDSRGMLAWGGTSGRSWFYDLSAGPEAWTTNWNVDDADLDGNGVDDYRMPPVWEYAPGGNRARDALPSDLGKVVRNVAINLLFTSSPLYDPMVTTPQPGGAKRVHLTMFEDDLASTGTDWMNTAESLREFVQLEPYHQWKVDLRDVDPIDVDSKKTLNIFAGLDPTEDCWVEFGDPFAQPFCHYDAIRDQFVPEGGDDYVVGVFAFNTTDEGMGDQFGLLGYADDNWTDGTQSYVFEFDYPDVRDAGFGFTTTTTHEVGHHLGLSHPHDGYDPETGVDYDAVDDFYYAWSGDESDTVMQYQGVSNGFGVFDRDNMARYQFAGYLNGANALLGELQGQHLSRQQRRQLARADALARLAQGEFRDWHFLSAAWHARVAWRLVSTVANEEGVGSDLRVSTTQARVANAAVPHEGDFIRFPDE